jgi:hypothetical protein
MQIETFVKTNSLSTKEKHQQVQALKQLDMLNNVIANCKIGDSLAE